MSASVCQGLQSCLEPGFLEPRAVIDKMAPPRSSLSEPTPWLQNPNFSQEQKDNSCKESKSKTLLFDKSDSNLKSNKNGEFCWNFMQLLDKTDDSHNGNQISQAEEEEMQVYVHPLAKRSSSTVSLEMCTESLGSETGSNSDETIDDLSCFSFEKLSNSPRIQRSRTRENFTKKMEKQSNFPPPLTLISGSDGIQLRPRREGGRLVLEAVTFSSKSCFQAERTDGRLKLFSLCKDGYANSGEEISQYESENADEEQDSSEEDDAENGKTCSEREEEEEEGSGGIIECEIETDQEFPRPSSRCKEEGPRNRGLQSWEPFWVAIS